MNLKIGIVGLPNVGKSTLFNALTGKGVPAENYPFCTIDPSVGIVEVPDVRLLKLSHFSQSAKTIPAVIQFVDIAGLVEGASKGEGLGNQFLSHIREVDIILQIVRVFEDSDITHVHGGINPLHDIEVINLELLLADWGTVSRRRHNIAKDVKKGDKEAVKEDAVLEKVEKNFDAGKSVQLIELNKEEQEMLKKLHLISMKPVLYVLNTKESLTELPEELKNFFKTTNAKWLSLDIKIEQNLSEISENEQKIFRSDLGITDKGLDEIITESFELLGLVTFFTTGSDETRGWVIPRDSLAPQAGSAIHTDFRDKFIRAEVIKWKELLDAGSFARAREMGLVRTEGKDYVVSDGDVIEFKI